MLTSLGVVAGGIATVVFGAYCWKHPELYNRYFHQTSLWAHFGARTPQRAVELGAKVTVVIGVVVALWGLVLLASIA